MPHSGPVKIAHVISGLGQGGAETMLVKLLRTTDRAAFAPAVVSLVDMGVMGPRIEALGIAVYTLGMRRGVPSAAGLLRLVTLLRLLNPDLVQTWMYHADLLGGLAARWVGIPVVWNIRQSDLDPRASKRSTRLTTRLCARLSHHVPRSIICCSKRAAQIHQALGYRPEIMNVIPNGFDTQAFRPDATQRARIREALGVEHDDLLVGLIARFDPQKNLETFIAAAAEVASRCPSARFLLCGEGVEGNNGELTGWIDRTGIRGRVYLLGPRNDIAEIMTGLDLAVSSSAFGEGFPNVLGEAMASGVPCVVTDVGDSAEILADTGRVVPPRQPRALASAVEAMLRLPPEERHRLGERARKRILEDFSIGTVTARYEKLYRHTLETA